MSVLLYFSILFINLLFLFDLQIYNSYFHWFKPHIVQLAIQPNMSIIFVATYYNVIRLDERYPFAETYSAPNQVDRKTNIGRSSIVDRSQCQLILKQIYRSLVVNIFIFFMPHTHIRVSSFPRIHSCCTCGVLYKIIWDLQYKDGSHLFFCYSR